MPDLFANISNLISLAYLFFSLRLSATIWRERRDILLPPLTAHKKRLAEQAAFLIAVPIAVLVHEFGHVLAVWWAGGQVEQFIYRFFWGAVVPIGEFSLVQRWVIAIAGTIGSLLFGLLIWLLFRRNSAPALRYFGLRAFRFQIYFALIYYPVFTLVLPIGDWAMIYDFQATPILSGLTAVCHVSLLYLFWRGDQQGWFERPAHETVADQERFRAVAQAATANPQDTDLQLQYIMALRRGGANHKAKNHLKRFLAQNPASARAHLEMGILQTGNKRQIPQKAAQNAEKALSLGLPDEPTTAVAHQILGSYYLDREDADKAVNHLNQAIALISKDDTRSQQVAHLYHQRSQAYRRQKKYEQSYQDIQQAISLARQAGDGQAMSIYESEVAVIEHHAGRPVGDKLVDNS